MEFSEKPQETSPPALNTRESTIIELAPDVHALQRVSVYHCVYDITVCVSILKTSGRANLGQKYKLRSTSLQAEESQLQFSVFLFLGTKILRVNIFQSLFSPLA